MEGFLRATGRATTTGLATRPAGREARHEGRQALGFGLTARLNLRQDGQQESGGLATAGAAADHQVGALQTQRNGLLLHLGGLGVAGGLDGGHQGLMQGQGLKTHGMDSNTRSPAPASWSVRGLEAPKKSRGRPGRERPRKGFGRYRHRRRPEHRRKPRRGVGGVRADERSAGIPQRGADCTTRENTGALGVIRIREAIDDDAPLSWGEAR
jgi:hypothetical protein